jgi:hypothetical protein
MGCFSGLVHASAGEHIYLAEIILVDVDSREIQFTGECFDVFSIKA